MNALFRTIALPAAALVCLALAMPASAPAQASGGVLVVGDSLEVGTSSYLQALLPGVRLTIDAEESRSSAAILDALRSRIDASQSVVVFDAGTNDDPASPDTLAANLAAAAGVAGPRCMVVATINRPPFNGYSVDGLNAVINSFAASRPGTQLVDWRAAALANPNMIYSDGVHPDSSGYQLRAELVAHAIQGCLVAAASDTTTTVPAAPDSEAPAAPPAPAAPTAAERARHRAETAALVGAEAFGRLRRLLGRQGAAGMFLITTALLRRG